VGSNFRGWPVFKVLCGRAIMPIIIHRTYIHTYFVGLIFVDSHLSMKTAKIGPHENFPLYGMLDIDLIESE
jgi:hypothetical protein